MAVAVLSCSVVTGTVFCTSTLGSISGLAASSSGVQHVVAVVVVLLLALGLVDLDGAFWIPVIAL